MVYKNTIQKILDKYLNFANKHSRKKEEDIFWHNITTDKPEHTENIQEVKKITTLFSAIEEIDRKIESKGYFEELKEKIDTYESTTIPIKNKPVFKAIYANVAAILLPIALIISAVFFLKTQETSSEYQIVSTEKGSTTKIVLEDGTTVWLNAESELKYPSSFKNQDKRIVTLTGEAYFDVARNEKQPFEVYAAGYRFKVLGTAFNVKAYPGEKKVETTLEHGKVNVEKLNKDASKPAQEVVSLAPKQTIVLYNEATVEEETENKSLASDKESEKVIEESTEILETKRPILIENEDLSTYLSWKDNMLVFKNNSLLEMVNILERRYNICIHIKDKNIEDLKFTGKFTVETPEQAIKIICIATKIDYEIEKDNVILKLNN